MDVNATALGSVIPGQGPAPLSPSGHFLAFSGFSFLVCKTRVNEGDPCELPTAQKDPRVVIGSPSAGCYDPSFLSAPHGLSTPWGRKHCPVVDGAPAERNGASQLGQSEHMPLAWVQGRIT